MGYRIITDSSASMPEEKIEKYGLGILTLSYNVDGKQYPCYEHGRSADMKQFYNMLRAKKQITTSQVNPEQCIGMFESILEEGEDILYLAFSSGLSGTYQSGDIAASMLRAKYPDRKIYVVDTLCASLGEGLLVMHACELKNSGADIDTVYNWAMENRLHLCHEFTVDDLFFLKRGGRVSASVAIVGTLLSIKPVMHMDDAGKLIPVGKARGRKASLDAMVKRMGERIVNPKGQMFALSHGDCLEDAEYIASEAKRLYGLGDVTINFVDPVIGAHCGPGTVALYYLGSQRD